MAHRDRVPHAMIADFRPHPHRPDPVDMVRRDESGRIRHLLPKRREKMLRCPFLFLRATAGIMALDLNQQKNSGIHVRSSGDCHLGNFGVIGAADSNEPVFDLNDFDEAADAPFEWDVKRLATSFVLKRQSHDADDAACRALAETAVQSYVTAMRGHATQSPVEVWRTRIDLQTALRDHGNRDTNPILRKLYQQGVTDSHDAYRELLEPLDQPRRFISDHKDIDRLTRDHHPRHRHRAIKIFKAYAKRMRLVAPERAVLLDRYELKDVASKRAGTGGLGRFCVLGLFLTGDHEPLLLQIKEAVRSVLHVQSGQKTWRNQGQRVVESQRILQAVPDPFLGWTHKLIHGRDFYVRRLKDARLSRQDKELVAVNPHLHAVLCGQALARAHARAGDPTLIAGYLGADDGFTTAIGDFAMVYARQVIADYDRVHAANARGQL